MVTRVAYRKPRKKLTKRKGHIIHHHCVNAEYISAKELPFGVQILGFIKNGVNFNLVCSNAEKNTLAFRVINKSVLSFLRQL